MWNIEQDLIERNLAVKRILSLLEAKQYAELESLAKGSRLSGDQVREAIAQYGRTIAPFPESELEVIDYIAYMGSQPLTWSTVVPLFTQEEGRSDLSIELELTLMPNGAYESKIDDIRVR